MSSLKSLRTEATQLHAIKQVKADRVLQKLLNSAIINQTELTRYQQLYSRDAIRGWEEVLKLMKRSPQRSLECLREEIGKEDATSRDIINKLGKLWISGLLL